MAAVEVTITGMLYDKINRTTQNVVLVGEASLTGLGIGGGPLPPGPGQPPGSGGVPVFPSHPIYHPPGISGPPGPWPTPPIVIPVPPDTPNLPPPGSPPVHIANTQPVQPMTPPAAVVIDYPGMGKVVVPQPTQSVQIPVPPGATPAPPVATPY